MAYKISPYHNIYIRMLLLLSIDILLLSIVTKSSQSKI